MKTIGNKKMMVYENLKRRIIVCELAPGMPINEADFASELGVSKTRRDGQRSRDLHGEQAEGHGSAAETGAAGHRQCGEEGCEYC